MLHKVVPDIDVGPVISYCSFQMNEPSYQECFSALRSTSYIKTWERMYDSLFSMIRDDQEKYEIPLVVKTFELMDTYGINEIIDADLTFECMSR
jgi:hypothetical protein